MSDEETPFKPKKRGGRRPGAGRPKGAVSKKKSIDFAMNLIKEGETPLEHMIKVMRAEFPPELKESIKNGELSPEIIKALTGWHNVRFEAAKNAAPGVQRSVPVAPWSTHRNRSTRGLLTRFPQ